jgi:hypothetical protein
MVAILAYIPVRKQSSFHLIRGRGVVIGGTSVVPLPLSILVETQDTGMDSVIYDIADK